MRSRTVVPVRRAAARPVVAVAAAALLLASCGGGEEDAGEQPSPSASPSPSSTVNVPDGVSLAESGNEISFGESATVIFEAGKDKGTVLDLTVTKATQGTVKDFSSFVLDDYTKNATPYYVNITVENVGESDVGGAPIPLWGVDADNTLLPAATFTSGFDKCASEPLPKEFAADAKVETCLVFLAPEKGTLEAVSFRPTQEFNPIVWAGDITTPKPAPKAQKKSKNG